VPLQSRSTERFKVEVPGPEEDWRIGVIVGPSGSGKSTIARQAFGDSSTPPATGPPIAPSSTASVICRSSRSFKRSPPSASAARRRGSSRMRFSVTAKSSGVIWRGRCSSSFRAGPSPARSLDLRSRNPGRGRPGSERQCAGESSHLMNSLGCGSHRRPDRIRRRLEGDSIRTSEESLRRRHVSL